LAARNAKPVHIVHKAGLWFKGPLCLLGGGNRNFVLKIPHCRAEQTSPSQLRDGDAQSFSCERRCIVVFSVSCLAPPVALAQTDDFVAS
jgi:hypothetical protein